MTQERAKKYAAIIIPVVIIIVITVIGLQFRYIIAPSNNMQQIVTKINEINEKENATWKVLLEACEKNKRDKILKAASDEADVLKSIMTDLEAIPSSSLLSAKDKEVVVTSIALLREEYQYRAEALSHISLFYETRKDEEIEKFDDAQRQADKKEAEFIAMFGSNLSKPEPKGSK